MVAFFFYLQVNALISFVNIIEATLLAFFSKTANKPIVVAYSGGVDSQVLLAALYQLKQQKKLTNTIAVCHVNHGLSKHASSWQEFAAKQCQQFSFPLITHQLSLKKQPQQSLEAMARDARYQCLVESSKEPALIVTGHHLDDQAETFFLSLKRGAGLKGLSAMSEQIQLAQHTLVRPLLAVSRAEIVHYAQQQNLTWIEDESNHDQVFDRNFLRHTVMPKLSARWPSFNDTLSRSVGHCQDAQSLLDELAEEDLVKVSITNKVLSIAELLNLSTLRFNNVIRYFLAKHDKLMPSSAQLQQIEQQMRASNDKNPAIKINDYSFRRYQQQLHLTDNFVEIKQWQHQVLLTKATDNITLPDNLGQLHITLLANNTELVTPQVTDEALMTNISIQAPKEGQQVSIRFSHNNPTCLPDYRNKSRALKKILQEAKIPTWQRQRIPFLYYDETLVAALGLFICKSHLPQQDSSKLQLIWLDNK